MADCTPARLVLSHIMSPMDADVATTTSPSRTPACSALLDGYTMDTTTPRPSCSTNCIPKGLRIATCAEKMAYMSLNESM
eukprot:193612-Pleurochrysis_carterae.AAC.2